VVSVGVTGDGLGWLVGSEVGELVGLVDGLGVGAIVGFFVGSGVVGDEVGVFDGSAVVGLAVGSLVGFFVGLEVVGLAVVGLEVVGLEVVGLEVVGLLVGEGEAEAVGLGVELPPHEPNSVFSLSPKLPPSAFNSPSMWTV